MSADEERVSQWSEVERSAAFEELMSRKRAFIVPSVAFIIAIFMGLPILASFTTILDGIVVGVVSWAYVYAFALFALAIVFCHIYVAKANRFDELAGQAKQEALHRDSREGEAG
ncbi:MAG: DUF485 domain-containing protein [Rubrobacter sp.]|nr:DUF485 domain-containing protein [Rubrobacter sp.]